MHFIYAIFFVKYPKFTEIWFVKILQYIVDHSRWIHGLQYFLATFLKYSDNNNKVTNDQCSKSRKFIKASINWFSCDFCLSSNNDHIRNFSTTYYTMWKRSMTQNLHIFDTYIFCCRVEHFSFLLCFFFKYFYSHFNLFRLSSAL